MKTTKVSAILSILSVCVLCLGAVSVHAAPPRVAPPAAPQPKMDEAIDQLQMAKRGESVMHLEKAKLMLEDAAHNKGGERKEAIEHINQALVFARKGEPRKMEEHIDRAIADAREGKREGKRRP